MKSSSRSILFIAAAVILVAASHAEAKPAALFSEDVVAQSGRPVPVWDTADPHEKVTVTLDGRRASAAAGPDGKWIVRLGKLKSGGPFKMTIAGTNTITVNDVLVGEVWLGSGQSNMVFNVSVKGHRPYGLLDEEKEIASANFPQLRMFTVKDAKSYAPETDVQGEWKVCTPDNVPDFSAIGYIFGRDLHQALKLPVGIILTAYGASTAEAWLPREALAADPELKPMLDRFDAREAYFREHPGATDTDAPGAPQTINSRPGRPGPLRDPVQDQHQPTVLYNAMLRPVIPYAIRGAIWYQGESIVGGAPGVRLYGHVMRTLITDWRKTWGEGDFPFFSVQLAALNNVSNNPAVREQQATILTLPNTGLVVTTDVGDPVNVHPKNKEPVGQRLANLALANVYGLKLESSGPVYTDMRVEGNTIRLRFSHATGLKSAPTPNQLAGLFKPGEPVAPPAPRPAPGAPAPAPVLERSSAPDPAVLAEASAHLHGFQIAGSDGKFVDAAARIDGESVIVSNPQVSAPKEVRYAWKNYPADANLYNAAGLPAAPFRTDQADALTPIAAEFTGR